jgi:hypothetical protein
MLERPPELAQDVDESWSTPPLARSLTSPFKVVAEIERWPPTAIKVMDSACGGGSSSTDPLGRLSQEPIHRVGPKFKRAALTPPGRSNDRPLRSEASQNNATTITAVPDRSVFEASPSPRVTIRATEAERDNWPGWVRTWSLGLRVAAAAATSDDDDDDDDGDDRDGDGEKLDQTNESASQATHGQPPPPPIGTDLSEHLIVHEMTSWLASLSAAPSCRPCRRARVAGNSSCGPGRGAGAGPAPSIKRDGPDCPRPPGHASSDDRAIVFRLCRPGAYGRGVV